MGKKNLEKELYILRIIKAIQSIIILINFILIILIFINIPFLSFPFNKKKIIKIYVIYLKILII